MLPVADNLPIPAEADFETLILQLELGEAVTLHQVDDVLYIFDIHDVICILEQKSPIYRKSHGLGSNSTRTAGQMIDVVTRLPNSGFGLQASIFGFF
jgi:hypothetical protein